MPETVEFTRQFNVRLSQRAHADLAAIRAETREEQADLITRLLREEAARRGLAEKESEPAG